MVHQRSEKAQIRRETKRYLFTVSYRDHILCETVSTVDVVVPMKVWREDGSYYWDGFVVDRGDVLMDSRGRGSFQQ